MKPATPLLMQPKIITRMKINSTTTNHMDKTYHRRDDLSFIFLAQASATRFSFHIYKSWIFSVPKTWIMPLTPIQQLDEILNFLYREKVMQDCLIFKQD